MSSLLSSACIPNGPFHAQAPEEFGSKKDKLEECGFKFKASLSIMHAAFKRAMDNVEEPLEQKVVDAYFNDGHGARRVELLEMASQLQWIVFMLSTGPVSTFLHRETATNGLESWMQLVQGYNIPTKNARVVGRLSRM